MPVLVRIVRTPSGELHAEGPRGWGRPFEGNFYISNRFLKTGGFKANYIPGFCAYKFLYGWLDCHWQEGCSSNLGWLYWLPNSLFPFIWFRVAVSQRHSELDVEYVARDQKTVR